MRNRWRMKASRTPNKIGMVIHGPEVIDSGFAMTAIRCLENLGKVTAILGGTMGRVAVIDAGLEDLIEISQREMPSQSIRRILSSVDAVVLLNQAKTKETGMAFGQTVAARSNPSKPFLQVDFGGLFVALLAGESEEFAETVASDLGLDLVVPSSFRTRIERKGQVVKRSLVGAEPGENISVNGTVIAKAVKNSVEILAQDGKIVEIKGAEPKMHGLEKLPLIDLEKAVLRSGDIRRTENAPRSLKCHDHDHEVALIDHAAEDTFETAKGAKVVVTVGDDTTAIAGDILSRLGIPQIGIVDGDPDELSHKTVAPSRSTIIKVRPGCDDIVGSQVKTKIFGGKCRMHLNGQGIEDLARKVKQIASEYQL
ncbi:MAG: DUF2117 domain-containing protein [Methanotrichaceae archaeon]